MPSKKRRARKAEDPAIEAKQDELLKLLMYLRAQTTEYGSYLDKLCISTSEKSTKLFMDHLKVIPKHIQDMTLSQAMELQKKETCTENSELELRALRERHKMESTKKKIKKEQKRSLSATVNNRPVPVFHPNTTFSRLSKVQSESSLYTPVSKLSRMASLVVTPKFDPRAPVHKDLARKPRAGEIVMSLSGSPLYNFMNDLPGKPCVTLNLGDGKVINITEETEPDLGLEQLEQIAEPLKVTIRNVKKKLDQILQS